MNVENSPDKIIPTRHGMTDVKPLVDLTVVVSRRDMMPGYRYMTIRQVRFIVLVTISILSVCLSLVFGIYLLAIWLTVFLAYLIVRMHFGIPSLFVGKQCRWLFSEEEVQVEFDGMKSIYGWNTFLKARETKGLLLIYVKPQKALFFPIDKVDRAQGISIRKLVREHVEDVGFE